MALPQPKYQLWLQQPHPSTPHLPSKYHLIQVCKLFLNGCCPLVFLSITLLGEIMNVHYRVEGVSSATPQMEVGVHQGWEDYLKIE